MAETRTIDLHLEGGLIQLDYHFAGDGTLELGRWIAIEAAYMHALKLLKKLRRQGVTRVRMSRAMFVHERVKQLQRRVYH